jgi:hypothetical protein
VGDHFGVGLAHKHIALGAQCRAQCIVVFNDAVVDQGDVAQFVGDVARAVAEMRVRVVLRRRAVGGPAGVGDAGVAFQLVGKHLRLQLGHPRCAARALEPARMDRDPARVITAVFQPR